MKSLYLLLCLAVTFSVLGQDPAPDWTETDCDGNVETVFEHLDANLPLLVIASGYDCSICRSEAPGFDVLADSLVGRARIWGAMNFRFSFDAPTCSNLDSWVSSYGWDNFFIFNDVNNGNKAWAQGGYTSYSVLDPTTDQFVYKGTSRTTALNSFFEVLAKVEQPTGIQELAEEEGVFFLNNGTLTTSEEIAIREISIFDLKGVPVWSEEYSGFVSQWALDLEELSDSEGLIVIKATLADGKVVSQKLYR